MAITLLQIIITSYHRTVVSWPVLIGQKSAFKIELQRYACRNFYYFYLTYEQLLQILAPI